ncbi:PTS system, mannose/fructose/sorbose family, IIC component [Actinomyces denticolens]|nr:PTS system, mannose/fructose/sorbose family, IIC component [Actinomyces denticolens]
MHEISTIQIILVTIVAFVAGLGSVLDERQFHRPLVACTLTGLALGQPTLGIVVGGTLELIALGWLNVGAAMAPTPPWPRPSPPSSPSPPWTATAVRRRPSTRPSASPSRSPSQVRP